MKPLENDAPRNRGSLIRAAVGVLGVPLMALCAIQIWRNAIIDGFSRLAVLRVSLVSFVFLVMLVVQLVVWKQSRAGKGGRD